MAIAATLSRPRAAARTLRVRGRDYPVLLPSLSDARLHVAAVLLTLQVLGQTVLNFRVSIAQIAICILAGALIEFLYELFKHRVIMWPASGMLTGNSTAFILRVPGTLHGQYWSLNGIEIFLFVVILSMASKYLIRWRGRHIFNPSNLGLVVAFAVLGPRWTEPQDLWWIPIGPWLVVTYAILVGGGLVIGWRLKLFGMQVAFMLGFAAALMLVVAPVPDHCMVASWRAAPICGWDFWQVVTTSPELMIFALFMLPDPRTVPEGRWPRIAFGLVVALLSVILVAPTTLEFWTKTAILASLVIACAFRLPVAALLRSARRAVEEGAEAVHARPTWQVPAVVTAAVLGLALIPVGSDYSTRLPQPAAGLSDGTVPVVTTTVGSGPALASAVVQSATSGVPAPDQGRLPIPRGASARVWNVPPVGSVTISPNVAPFDPSFSRSDAKTMAHDLALDLIIEAEARRTHDIALAGTGAVADGLTLFTNQIHQDVAAGHTVVTRYTFDRATVVLFLPKFATQAPRLTGMTITGTVTLTVFDRSGHQISQTVQPYSHSWSVFGAGTDHSLIDNDYQGLEPA
jgi:hypothetical protein